MLVGPTASGKTGISLELAAETFEIISADSVQVYRLLDIGSGKPTRTEREKVIHHCIDIVDPDFNFTAGEFCRRAVNAVREIKDRGKIPFFAGGTGLYIDAFFQGLADIPPVEQSVRMELLQELERDGLVCLYRRLRECDPEFAGRIHPNDRQRILRGLEVFRQFNKPLSGFFDKRSGHESDKTLYIGLNPDRSDLAARIDRRVDMMLAAGFVDEVRSLRDMGYGSRLKSMRSIGYAEVNAYLDGKLSPAELGERIKTNTRHYAKRQMTWFRRNKRIRWFSSCAVGEIRDCVSEWITRSA